MIFDGVADQPPRIRASDSCNLVRSELYAATFDALLSGQMEHLDPRNEVLQEVAGSVHDDKDSEVSRAHP